jgi:hypothetical protein
MPYTIECSFPLHHALHIQQQLTELAREHNCQDCYFFFEMEKEKNQSIMVVQFVDDCVIQCVAFLKKIKKGFSPFILYLYRKPTP